MILLDANLKKKSSKGKEDRNYEVDRIKMDNKAQNEKGMQTKS